jgi:hypothetical protein
VGTVSAGYWVLLAVVGAANVVAFFASRYMLNETLRLLDEVRAMLGEETS